MRESDFCVRALIDAPRSWAEYRPHTPVLGSISVMAHRGFSRMKAFLSWSGDKSHRIAVAFAEWIPCVVQAIDPWISSKDIDRGSIWFNEIFDQLKDTNFGVVFVTKENQDKPWLLFESGALSKGLAESRICTVLIDLNVRDIDSGSPLRQINHTTVERDSVLSLVKTINKRIESGQVQEKRLEQTFNALWPDLERKIQEILSSDPAPTTPERNDKDVLNDILENVLRINKRVSLTSHRSPSKYMEQHHARTLVKQLLKMDLDRGDILEATESLIPTNWLNRHLDGYLGKDPEDEASESES